MNKQIIVPQRIQIKKRHIFCSLGLFMFLLWYLISCNNTNKGGANNAELAYRNTVDTIPKGYKGPIFEMSKDYPEKLDSVTEAECPWLFKKVDFKNVSDTSKWMDYISSVVKYTQENVKANDSDFVVAKDWYTLPWLAADAASGREFTHGARYSFPDSLTNFVRPGTSTAKNQFVSVWASTYVNKYGGYALGKMWSKNGDLLYVPNEKTNEPQNKQIYGLPWPEGTVFAKVNMIGNLQEEYLDSLNHLGNPAPPTWKLNIHSQSPGVGKRELRPVYLMGLDISVRDNRSPTGWVYITLKYDTTKPIDTVNIWNRFTLTGFIFGNDPESFPGTPAHKPLQQSYLTKFANNWHTGCSGRLENFIGTKTQSCIGCHRTSSFIDTPQTNIGVQRGYTLVYRGKNCNTQIYNDSFAYYFQNTKYPQPYRKEPKNNPENVVSLDYVLVLYDVINFYYMYRKQ